MNVKKMIAFSGAVLFVASVFVAGVASGYYWCIGDVNERMARSALMESERAVLSMKERAELEAVRVSVEDSKLH